MVAGLFARHPIAFQMRAAQPIDDFVPTGLGPAQLDKPKAGRMGEQVPQRDRLFTAGGKGGQVVCDRLIELQFAGLNQLQHGGSHDRLGRGEPEHDRIGGHWHAGPALANRQFAGRLAPDRRIDLRPDVQPLVDAPLDDGLSPW